MRQGGLRVLSPRPYASGCSVASGSQLVLPGASAADRSWSGVQLTMAGTLVTAGCIDTDPPASRRTFGQSQKSLTGIEYAHHALWVTFTETRCNSSGRRQTNREKARVRDTIKW